MDVRRKGETVKALITLESWTLPGINSGRNKHLSNDNSWMQLFRYVISEVKEIFLI
jgi:hypothetical protein